MILLMGKDVTIIECIGELNLYKEKKMNYTTFVKATH